jgi:splicing factor 3B subunit 3
MHLLNLTRQPPTSITVATVGSFSGTKGQEILAVRGSTKLEILKLNASTGQCEIYG